DPLALRGRTGTDLRQQCCQRLGSYLDRGIALRECGLQGRSVLIGAGIKMEEIIGPRHGYDRPERPCRQRPLPPPPSPHVAAYPSCAWATRMSSEQSACQRTAYLYTIVLYGFYDYRRRVLDCPR